jgi:hypothetical protein
MCGKSDLFERVYRSAHRIYLVMDNLKWSFTRQDADRKLCRRYVS